MRQHLAMIVINLALALFPATAQAEITLPTEAADPILTIVVPDQTYVLDRDALTSLPAQSFTTSTIWTEGPQEFTGLAMADLLAILTNLDETLTMDRLNAASFTLIAANGYQIEVPIAHYSERTALIAYARNGQPMTLRDKGPLWIVYPFDTDPMYRSEVIYANSIWQLEQIVFTE